MTIGTRPHRTINNFSPFKPRDYRTLCSSETWIDGFLSSRIGKGLVVVKIRKTFFLGAKYQDWEKKRTGKRSWDMGKVFPTPLLASFWSDQKSWKPRICHGCLFPNPRLRLGYIIRYLFRIHRALPGCYLLASFWPKLLEDLEHGIFFSKAFFYHFWNFWATLLCGPRQPARFYSKKILYIRHTKAF